MLQICTLKMIKIGSFILYILVQLKVTELKEEIDNFRLIFREFLTFLATDRTTRLKVSLSKNWKVLIA